MTEQLTPPTTNKVTVTSGTVAYAKSTVFPVKPEAKTYARRGGRLQEDENLLENLNEVYGEPMEEEEREFLRHGKDYHRRRLSAE
jgi:hypothetical protein